MFQMFSDLHAFRRDPLALLSERGRSGSNLSRLHLGPRPVYLVTEVQLARTLLRSDEQDIDKGRYVAKLRQLLGLNSLTLSGKDHQLRRAVVHRALAQSMADAGTSEIGAAVRQWVLELTRTDVLDVHQATGNLALRLVCAMLFGCGALSSGDEAALIEAVNIVEADLAADMFRLLPLSPWAATRREQRRRLSRRIMASVVDRTASRATRVGLVADLRAAGLEGEALQDEILFLLLAGHHTTGAASAWTLYHQAVDPGLADGLAAEASRIQSGSGELNAQALRGATLSRGLVSEALRLYPSSYWTSRELTRAQMIAGQNLKRGTTLIVAPWQLHRDARYWSDPDAFRLDRAWTANPAYMPFGFGGRACTGMSMATFMLQLIALEVAGTFECHVVSAVPPPPPLPSVTLMPPPIRFRLVVRGTTNQSSTEVAA